MSNWLRISFTLCLLFGYALAQQSPNRLSRIDSLELRLQEEMKDTDRLQLMLELGKQYSRVDHTQTVKYSDDAIELAARIKDTLPLIEAYHIQIAGLLYLEHPDSLDFDNLHSRAALLLQNQDAPELKLQNTFLKAGIFWNRTRLDSAYVWYQKTLVEARATGNKRTEFLALNEISNILGLQGAPEKKEYAEQALAVAEELECEICISGIAHNLGNYYFENGQPQLALNHYLRAKRIREKVGDKMGIIATTCHLCMAYYQTGDTVKARQTIQEGIRMATEAERWESLIPCLVELAELEYHDQNYEEALAAANKGLEFMENLSNSGSFEREQTLYNIMAKSYAELGEYQLAYEASKQFKATSDTVQFNQARQNMENLKVAYNATELSYNNQLLEQQLENQQLLTYVGMLGISLLALMAFVFYSRFRAQKRSGRELERLVRERTHELQATNAELEQTNAELESFVYVASHDFKEPLRNISSFLGLMKRRLPESVLEEQEESFGFINSAVQQLRTLVADIKVFTKVRSMTADPEPIALATVVEEVWEQVAPTFQDKQVDLSYEAAALPTLLGYRSQVYIVMKNLLENAVKYSAGSAVSINIWSHSQNDQHEIFVQDNGIGIPEPYHAYVFQMFKRLHNREQYQGSGMGLAICARVLKAVGGKIWIASSEEGKGTTFGFSLPKQPKQIPVSPLAN